MRVLALALATLVAALGAGPDDQPTTAGQPPPATGGVVVLGTAGLTWDDISGQTPALAALLGNGSIAALVPRSVELVSCPVDGALAVSAGRRADAPRTGAGPHGCRTPKVDSTGAGRPGRVTDWPDYLARAAEQGLDAHPGTLGQALAESGRSSAALGPLAAVALAGPDGTAPQVWPGLADLPGALQADPDVLVADLPRVTSPVGSPGSIAQVTRDQQVAVVDAALVETLNALPDDAVVVVVSLSDAPGPARLQLAAMVGPAPAGLGPALLRSASTRQDGLVQTTDVLPTVLERVGVRVPDRVDGAPMLPVQAGRDAVSRLERLLDVQDVAAAMSRLRTPYYVVTVGITAALLVGLAWLLRARRRAHPGAESPATLRAMQTVALVGAALPAAGVLTALVPWWRTEAPGVALVAVAFGWAAVLAGVALAGPWRRHPLGPPTMVGALTAGVLIVNAAAGSPLTLVGLLGGDPLTGGRFYGFDNPLFALFGSAVVVLGLGLATWLDRAEPDGPRPGRLRGRRTQVAVLLAVLGLFAAVVNVLPALGADVGGPPALLPAMALLALRARGVPLTWVRAALVGAATAALLAVALVADWLRPPADRTHLGRFVQTLLDGGAWNVMRRKVVQNLEILTSSALTMTVPVLAALVVWALARPERFGLSWVRLAYTRHRLLRDALVALGLLAALGFAANDSGTSIPPVVALFTLPVLLAVCSATVAAEPSAPRR